MTSTPLKKLIVRVYPGEDGKMGHYALYEDDGISQEYMHGRRALTDLYYTRKGDKHEIMVCPARGSYTGQLESRSYTIEVAGTRRAESAEFNEKLVAVEYDG